MMGKPDMADLLRLENVSKVYSRGLIYLVDRVHGVDIIETNVF